MPEMERPKWSRISGASTPNAVRSSSSTRFSPNRMARGPQLAPARPLAARPGPDRRGLVGIEQQPLGEGLGVVQRGTSATIGRCSTRVGSGGGAGAVGDGRGRSRLRGHGDERLAPAPGPAVRRVVRFDPLMTSSRRHGLFEFDLDRLVGDERRGVVRVERHRVPPPAWPRVGDQARHVDALGPGDPAQEGVAQVVEDPAEARRVHEQDDQHAEAVEDAAGPRRRGRRSPRSGTAPPR